MTPPQQLYNTPDQQFCDWWRENPKGTLLDCWMYAWSTSKAEEYLINKKKFETIDQLNEELEQLKGELKQLKGELEAAYRQTEGG